VPDTARAEAALAASSARTVARYDAFTLVEARGDDDANLRAAGADRRDDMRRVSLPGGDLDPLQGRDSLASRDAPELDEALAVIQFEGPVKDAWLERLRSSGVRIVQYMPQNGYLVHAGGAEVDRLAGLVGTDTAVRAVTRVTAADKLSEELAGDASTRRVAVQTLVGADGADARRAAATAGPSVRGGSEAAGLSTQYLTLGAAERQALAADPAVVSISPYSTPVLLDERSAQIVAGNLSGGAPTGGGDYLDWLTSQEFGTGTLDFAIDIADSGVDTGSLTPGHPDFYDSIGTSRVRYVHDWTGDGSARDCIGHGSNVASIAAGFPPAGAPQDGAGFRYGLGAAPRVEIGVSKFFNCAGQFDLAPGGFAQLAADAHEAGARISNNSWGNQDYGGYTADSRLFDAIVRDARPSEPGHQQMVEVFAAGNEADGLEDQAPQYPDEGWGSIASPGTAKNVITVGASESYRPLSAITCGLDDGDANDADDIASFSSRGPTDDGRLKPDLVAPGTRVTGAAPQIGTDYTGAGVCQKSFPTGNTLYNLQSGTSQAAPAVSGAAALIRDWYAGEHGGTPPSPALTKAILVNTATDLAGGDNGRGDETGSAPNADQGWGRAHLGAVLDGTQRAYLDQTSTLGNSGARFGRSYAVADSTRPLKVTLAWTDAPGMVSTDAFVNDLDLVVRQGGRTYKGNAIAGGRSIIGGAADRRNNLESVLLPAGAQGPFSVEVRGTTVAGDGVPGNADLTDQDFALVVSNAQQQSAPVLAPETATVDDASGGDGDSKLEPSEPFALNVDLANGGDAAATSVTGSISGPGLAFSQGSAGWDNIAPGAVAASAAPMSGTLAAGSECGVDVEATLALLASGQASQTVPVTLPTGEPGPPLNHSRTPNLAIPDEDSRGAVATMTIATAARVKDLNVRVSLAHQWVGDLMIELTSPQGTTVRLANHPGGPDNFGQNLINTVFDDEAGGNISAGTAPYTGSFRPQDDQLSRFDGQRLQGTWTLRVRDLFEGKTGSIQSWGTTTSPAICDFDGSVLPDTTPPETSITAGPSGARASQAASFSFAASEPDSIFECGLDGGAFTPCNSTHSVGGLPEGPHTLRVRARDPADNVDPSPAEIHWTVDVSAPALSIDSPGAGAALLDARPRISGTAGAAASDAPTVNVNLWRGSLASGLPAQTLVVPRDAASGAWSVVPARLSDGTWTARVEQADAAGNTGFSQARTFSVDTTGPDFAIVPVESDRADALKGKLTVVAGCGTRCKVTAELRGSGRRPPLLGRVSKDLAPHSPAAIRVKLTKKGRAALRRSAKAKTKLTTTIAVGSRSRVVFSQPVVFRKVNLDRVADRGLSFAGRCSEQCSISANLLMRASDARRYGLRPPSTAPVPVAGGSARSSASTTRLVLRPSKASRRALRRARRLDMTFEALVRAPSGPSYRASHALTLRR
jgi:subtilisin-like proprotein convertase family protein